jgi:hypothetical protein
LTDTLVSVTLAGIALRQLKMNFTSLNNINNETKDMVVLSVPWTETTFAIMAPAALKPVVEKAGLSCLAIDLNGDIVNLVNSHPNREEIISFFFDGYVNKNIESWLNDMFISAASQIVSYKPKYVGISVFSYLGQHSMKWLAYFIRKLDPTIKIIIGGPGCLQHNFTGPAPLAEELVTNGIVDYHIRGDGEHALFELLTGNDDYSGINDPTWKELNREELSLLPIPDYTDYDFSIYNKKILGIMGSRGCVRKCKFCDYIENWKNFTWRTADHVFSEMIEQNKKYNIRTFKFQDALTNGNLKEFHRFTSLLSEYNRANPDNSFSWSGYYIFRERIPTSERDWELVAGSGAEILIVGIEKLNEHIRYHMGKKFSNASIDFHLEQAQKYGIKINFLALVGWVNEVRKDIDYTKKWLDEHVRFKDVITFQWGGSLGIFTNTYLDRHKDELGITMIGSNPQAWINKETGSTPEVRAEWVTELNNHSKALGYTVHERLDNHFILETLMNAKN